MSSSLQVMELEQRYACHNYHPLSVVAARARGAHVWDPEGRKYLDFLSAYSSVNQGHCHPAIVKALVDQAHTLTLCSRAFYSDQLGPFAKFVTEYFGYESMLPMNTGAEAVESGIKLARKWGYMKKGIPDNEAIVFSCTDNFHGRTTSIISMSTDLEARTHFGPYMPNVGPYCPKTGKYIRFNHIEDLEEALEHHGKNVAAFLVEPIQGEAGVVVPDDGYMAKAFALCKKHNVLFIADEIQTGICRTGKLLATHYDGIKPDIVLLGKAVAGGCYPVSLVLSDKHIMDCIQPGEHGSTFGGNPLACAVATAALTVAKEEKLSERAFSLGQKFREALRKLNSPLITAIRGRGLLNAIVLDESKTNGRTAVDFCIVLKEKGLLAKYTHGNIVRLAPPIVISEEDLLDGVKIIGEVLETLPNIEKRSNSYHAGITQY
ncbi:Ornithine aminotransferase car2 [Neolecta irregularis DAH-3]|uniref:Ornithine aminotransferase n=1 Tax=Neolecta irregularis (strain DAH-3) TaxID=1198029 RepID=A0A1U7LSY6_NEOID|nr:Ornithine aminotransferase car2 [Neolecta irregularis DAH-3]|eukprot:OLL25631.1 Ornithine aminotransferase car2 [Neolecta irregularis DAH-3]